MLISKLLFLRVFKKVDGRYNEKIIMSVRRSLKLMHGFDSFSVNFEDLLVLAFQAFVCFASK